VYKQSNKSIKTVKERAMQQLIIKSKQINFVHTTIFNKSKNYLICNNTDIVNTL
jgi:NACalpha-BTF3-like transcription factor